MQPMRKRNKMHTCDWSVDAESPSACASWSRACSEARTSAHDAAADKTKFAAPISKESALDWEAAGDWFSMSIMARRTLMSAGVERSVYSASADWMSTWKEAGCGGGASPPTARLKRNRKTK